MVVNNTAALLQCAVSGLGTCILDLGSVKPNIEREQRIRVLPELEQHVARVSLVWMASKHRSVNVRTIGPIYGRRLGRTVSRHMIQRLKDFNPNPLVFYPKLIVCDEYNPRLRSIPVPFTPIHQTLISEKKVNAPDLIPSGLPFIRARR